MKEQIKAGDLVMVDEGQKLLKEAKRLLLVLRANWGAPVSDAHLDALKSIDNRIDAYLETGGWISVTERLPEDDEEAICVARDRQFIFDESVTKAPWKDWHRTHARGWHVKQFAVGNSSFREISMWQPLPPLPKEKP